MGIKRGTEKVPIITVSIPSFSGGMNTAKNRKILEDNEAFQISDMEFDDSNDLVTRNGFTTDGTGRTDLLGSVYVFSTETAFVGILYNHNNNVVSRPLVLGSETNLGTFANAGTGRWYWKQLANVAVAATNGDTIQVVGGAPGTASVLAAAPDSRYIEEWRSRLFLVHSANPNRVQCSDLGSATVYNTGGLTNPAQGIIFDAAPGDGDVITALFAFKERLFIFKRRRIYVLRAVAIPETDPSNWELVEYSKNIGCISQSSVREVFDDVLFLSEGGLCSLAAAEGTGDFASALVSQKIQEIQRINQDVTELDIFAFTLIDKSQYWLCLQSAATGGSVVAFVLDYKRIREGEVKWVRFTRLVPTAMDAYRIGQSKIVYVLGFNGGAGSNRLGKYTANLLPASRTYKDVLNGVDQTIIWFISTKVYTMGSIKLRKLFKEWALTVEIPTFANDLTLTVSYQLYPLVTGNDNTYPDFVLDSGLNFDFHKVIRRALLWNTPRKGRGIHFQFLGDVLNQGAIIRDFELNAALISDPVTEDQLA